MPLTIALGMVEDASDALILELDLFSFFQWVRLHYRATGD